MNYLKNSLIKQNIQTIDVQALNDFALEPDKYVYSFSIKEKHKVRDMLTYNKGVMYGERLKKAHYNVASIFEENFCERNLYSFAYHKNVRCKDALESHLKSNYFIKLDIHHFFESITEEVFFKIYKDRFNKKWTEILKGCFYKKNLCIGFVTSPVISDFFMSKFDNIISEYLEKNTKIHYSRYCDDILISSEEDDDKNLKELFELVKKELNVLNLSLNEKKTRFIKLDYDTHNSISFLGLNISKQDEVNNKITISKNYILFLLKLIEKNNKYENRCKGLLDEINSRVAYLAYNSPISFQKFQMKHIRKFGLSYNFVPKKPMNRYYGSKTENIYDWDEYAKDFVIDIHTKVVDDKTKEVILGDSIQLVRYIGTEENVIIPPFVDSIGKNAFKCNNKIKKIILNNKLRSIDRYAFFGCNSLEEIELPNSLTYIGTSAFENCGSLKNITISKKVKSIRENTFLNSGLENVVFNEGLKTIECNAFAHTKIENLQLPNTLEELQHSAFFKCLNLKSINFSETLLSIPSNCFYGCKSLKTINFSNSILSIEDKAFGNCSNLEYLFIPKNIINIAQTSFELCNSLEYINVDKENKVLDSRNNCNAIIETQRNKLIIATKNTKVEDGIEIIGNAVFANSLVTDIKLPKTVKVIEAFAFSNCNLLKSIELSENITEIGKNAFANCVSLTKVELPPLLTEISESLFVNCTKLENISLPKQLNLIGVKAFYNAHELSNISFPETLTSIEYKAFGNCYSMKNIYIPANVNLIKPYAFSGCSKKLETIRVNQYNTKYDSRNDCNAIIETKKNKLLLGCKNTKVEYGVKEIADFAFAYCKDLHVLNLPKTTVSIGDSSFIECTSLLAVDLNNVNKIGKNAFEGCISLLTINLPNSLVKIGNKCFNNCSSLKDLFLPDSAINIDGNTFNNCNNIENIFIPKTFRKIDISMFSKLLSIKSIKVDKKNPYYDSREDCNAIIRTSDNTLILGCDKTKIPVTVRKIGVSAFKNRKLPKNLELPSSIKVIEENAFANCELLEELVLPKNLTKIEAFAFAGNKLLKKIEIPKSVKVIDRYAFANCESLEEVILPDTKIDIREGVFSWCTSLKKINLPSKIEIIPARLFCGCDSLSKLNLPIGLSLIGFGAFYGTKIKSIKIPKDVKKIESNAFLDCSELEKITLPTGINCISSSLFEGCKKLMSITIPRNVEIINDMAFANCESLKSIVFSKKLKHISSSVFENCFSLEEIILPEGIKKIGRRAFANAASLTAINLPASLEEVYNDIFENCSNLKTINIDSQSKIFNPSFNNLLFEEKTKILMLALKGATIPKNTREIAERTFENRDDITEIIIPDTVVSINPYAFSNCKNLEKVTLSSNLIRIGKSAFENCPKLSKIIIPNKVICIEDNAFKNCILLKDLIFEEPEIIYSKDIFSFDINVDNRYKLIIKCEAFANCKSLEKVSFSNKITYVSDMSFANCTSLKELYISENLVKITSNSFYNCSNSLEKIEVDTSNKFYNSINNCNAIIENKNKKLVLGCKNTIIPDDIIQIGYAAFINNSYLKEIIIPNNVDTINKDAFKNCTLLKEIVIPSSVTNISNNVFSGCSNLELIKVDKNNLNYLSVNDGIIEIDTKRLIIGCKNTIISEDITSIAEDSFEGISTLKKIFIPKNLLYIPKSVFRNCNNIEKISVDIDNPYYDSRNDCNAIISSKENMIIKGCKNSTIEDDIISIGEYAFENCKIKNLIIPKSLQYIETGSFYNCKDIESIVVDKDNKVYDSRNNCNAIISTKSNKLFLSCKNSILSDEIILFNKNADYQDCFGYNSYCYLANYRHKYRNDKEYIDYDYSLIKSRNNSNSFYSNNLRNDRYKYNSLIDNDPFARFCVDMSCNDNELPF